MTVPEILQAAGHPLGSHGRTRCPLHDGAQNHATFSFTDTRWHCFAGCGGGGPGRLRHLLLGPERGRMPHAPHFALGGLESLADEGGAITPFTRPSAWLLQALDAKQGHSHRQHGRLHYLGEVVDRQIRALLALGRDDPDRRDALTEQILSLVPWWRSCYDQAHRVCPRAQCLCPW